MLTNIIGWSADSMANSRLKRKYGNAQPVLGVSFLPRKEAVQMVIQIRRAEASDAAELLDYLKQIGGETDNLTFGAEGLPFTVEAEAAFLKQLRDSRDDIMLIAKADGKIVGNASLNRLPRRMSHRGDLAVSVRKAYWNQGIGRKLLEKLLEFAGEKGFEVLELQVRSDNLAAIHLYEKLGFRKIGTHPLFMKIQGKPVNADLMILELK